MKFQVGDVVRRIVGSNTGPGPDGRKWTLPVGIECLIIEVQNGSGWLSVIAPGVPMDEEHDCQYFELVYRKVADPVPDVRNTDPDTSVAAAKEIKPKKLSIKASILDLLDKYKTGLTGEELAGYTGYRLNSVTPRFAELYRDNKIKVSGNTPSRSGQTVWLLV